MERAWRRAAIGIFDIVSAVSALSAGSIIMLSVFRARQPLPPLKVSLLATAAFFAVLGILALVGGICVLGRKARGLALAGSIAASLSPLPLGIPATILMLLAPAASTVIRVLVFVVLSPIWLIYLALLVLLLLGYSL